MTTIVNMVNQYAEKIYNQSEQTTIVNVQSKIFYFDQNYSSSSDTFGLGMSYELIVLL